MKRSGCVLLLVVSQFFSVTGFFQAGSSDRAKHHFLSSPLAINAGVRVTSVATFMTTPDEEQMVSDFKMITENESKLRKIGGVIIGVVTAAKFLSVDPSYSALSTGAFVAISTYRTGSEYQ